MATFTLVTSRRSRQQRRAPLRAQTEHKSPAQLIAERGSRDFRRQFPTNHDASGHYAAVTVAPQGAWKSAFKANHNAVQSASKRVARSTAKVAPKNAATPLTIDCSYCHEPHHIRNCERAASATAKKQGWKSQSNKERAEERFSRAEERLRQQILAAQMAKKLAQQPVVEEDSDSSESDYEEEDAQTVDNSDQIADLEKQIEAKKAGLEGASWADAADIEDEIDDLSEQLAALREN